MATDGREADFSDGTSTVKRRKTEAELPGPGAEGALFYFFL